jgi:arylsulfatase
MKQIDINSIIKFLLTFCILIGVSCYDKISTGFDENVNTEKKINRTRINSEPERPNIIIVLSDDQGYGDFSCHGNPLLKTPALDKLHDESIRLSDFHVTPLCTPTRGQLLTGMDAMHNKAATVLTARNIIRRDLSTFPEILRKEGYATGIFGKWHLGNNYPDRPMDKGFEKCIWHKGWGLLSEIEYDNDYYETRYLDSLEIVYSKKYCTNLWFDKAIEWMEEKIKEEKPFFSYISLNAPHGPFDSQMQDFNIYKSDTIDIEESSFLGMIRNIDRNMFLLDKWLEKTSLKENTIVIYMNDNGTAKGENIFNAHLRGKKGSIYEGGHRAACFIRWPNGNLGPSRDIPFPTQIQDLMPTIMELVGIRNVIPYKLDGMNLKPYLQSTNTRINDRIIVVQYGGHEKPEKYFSSVLWKNWRLVGNDELYNLEKDIGQKQNVIDQHPDIFQKMKIHYDKWWAEIEPGIDQFVPLIVGSKLENPVIINSDYWEEGAVNTQWGVAGAKGSPRGGKTHLKVVASGTYKIELSRWPFNQERELTSRGLEFAVGGTKIWEGRSLPIKSGCIIINDNSEIRNVTDPHSNKISFEKDLAAGDHAFQAWFRDENDNDLCGAYYVRFTKI